MSGKTSDKARKLIDENKVRKDMETDKRVYFTVRGDTDDHSVIFDVAKNNWTCDCRFSALTNRECSHIMACKTKKF